LWKLRAPDYDKRNLPDFRKKYNIPFYNEVAHIINGETIVHRKVTVDCLVAMRWKIVEDNEEVLHSGTLEDTKDPILSHRAKKAWVTRKKNLKERAQKRGK